VISYPGISVITPSFNQARYLERTIKSVIYQEYPNLEYMIMDGGSTDGSIEIIERYSGRLAYYQSGPDKGQGDAIWQGINKSTGTIFAWLNSDDVYLPGALNLAGRYFAQHPDCSILAGNCLRIGPEGQILSKAYCAPRQSVMSQVFWGCWCLQPAVFWRRDLLLAAGPIDADLVVTFDSDFAIRYTRLGNWHKIENFLAAIRIHESTKTTRLKDLAVEEQARYLRRYGYFNVHPCMRFALRVFYRGRYEIERALMTRIHPLWHGTPPVWSSNPQNADPV
jgi:glycosyltransferase involved in cell wall biosynthesis